ncbi:MAG: peptidoglycan editing factor PgeF [Oscillospiraceae bacterium]|nr:peptidoglycan editing factor PgeF [Oscillospiraceae bacterium]
MIEEKFIDNLELLVAENIAVTHAFTTRHGGVSPAPFDSLNLGLYREDDPENVAKNHALLAEALGYDPKKLVLTHQIHSDIVRAVTSADAAGIDHHAYPECDALITNEPGVALFVFTADCTPILLHDPVTGAVGAVHAGWRGTAGAIVSKTVEKMVALYGCDPKNIRAAIGPNIGFCCFETDADVPEAMLKAHGEEAKMHIRSRGDKYYVNLKELNAIALRRSGVTDIAISDACTVCQCDRFWSHRVTKGIRGSQGAIIVCK